MDGSVVSHLNLSSTRVEDGGSYSCMAGNQAGTIMHQARLNIYGPAWVRPMGVVTAVAGETLYLVCPVAGHPITNITWEKDSRHVTSDGHQRVLANGTLVISAVQRNTDGGSYSCTATDAHGRQHQSTATLRVMVPPTILSFNMGEVNAGMRIQVLCSAQGGDLPMNITWLKDGHHLNSNLMDGLTIKTLDQYSKILLLSELQGHHSGNYSCQASNAAKTVETSAVLVVRVPPTWVTSPHDLAATVGSSVVIPCHAEGFPKPRITWRKNTKVDSDNYRSIGGVQVSSNGSLVLPNIQHIDEGRYLCEADNSVGPPLRATVSLSVNAPPKFDQSLQQIMSVRRGSSATLACLANGDPPITLNWQAAHTTVQKHSTVREISGGVRGELVLSSVSNSDAGSFTCSASNMHGSDTFTIMLQVQDVPPAPHGLRVTERGSRFLVVSWLKHNEVVPLHKYIVQYKPFNALWQDGTAVNSVSGEKNSVRLMPLLPDTSYLVRIRAANQIGESAPSEPLQVSTIGEAPSAAPSSVRAEPTSSTSIRVTWDQPPSHTHHSNLIGYSVGIGRHGSVDESSYNFSNVETTVLKGESSSSRSIGSSSGGQVVLTRLQAWTQYQVTVRAYNTHGSGPLSAPVTVRTHEDVPMSAPIGVECSPGLGGDGSLLVNWLPPPAKDHNGNLRLYHLILSSFDYFTDTVNELVRHVSGIQETVNKLKPWTNYTVTVAATTRAGTGPFSTEIICTTPEDVAGVPSGLKVLQSSQSSAIVSWLPPNPPKGVLHGYTLYHRQPNSHKDLQYPLQPMYLSHTVKRLSQGTHVFWLTARTQLGEGPPITPVRLTLKENVAAGLSSLSTQMVSQQGQDIRMSCVTVGIPAVTPVWSKALDQISQDQRIRVGEDGSLMIQSVTRDDRGNYTCSLPHTVRGAHQLYKSVAYTLYVQVPPSPPSVLIAEASSSSLTVSWTVVDTGGAAVRTWALWWRADKDGEAWHTTEFGRITTKHTIRDLHCGKQYQLYVTAASLTGVSPPSTPLTARTSGSPPIAPATQNIASSNTTGAWVWLGRWMDGGCPITHYSLKLRRPQESSWTTLASSLAPQDVYEIGGLRRETTYGLQLTAYNAAGATTATVSIRTGPGLALSSSSAISDFQNDTSITPLHRDPRLLVSASASLLTLVLTVATIIICLKRRSSLDQSNKGNYDTKEAEENKKNLLHQPEGYYATVRKPQPVSGLLERIPENSEDICPYATFQGNTVKGDTKASRFQTYIYQDNHYGVTEARPQSSPTTQGHNRQASHGKRSVGGLRSESEEYDSMQSDSETEVVVSSRTESSNQLDSATLESHAHLHYLPVDRQINKPGIHQGHQELQRIRANTQNVHHNLIYHAPESSTSTEPSPVLQRKSLPRKQIELIKMNRSGTTSNSGKLQATIAAQETSFSNIKKQNQLNYDKNSGADSKYNVKINPPIGFLNSHNDLSAAECDLEILGRQQNRDNPTRFGHPTSQFRSYIGAGRDNKDYSIKV